MTKIKAKKPGNRKPRRRRTAVVLRMTIPKIPCLARRDASQITAETSMFASDASNS